MCFAISIAELLSIILLLLFLVEFDNLSVEFDKLSISAFVADALLFISISALFFHY
jgi:hypothetical protein